MSTIDAVRNHLFKLKNQFKSTNPSLFNNITEEIHFYEKVLDWTKSQCDIITIRSALKINRLKREEIKEIFGRPSLETILIAAQSRDILYSDDLKIRELPKDHKVRGIWT